METLLTAIVLWLTANFDLPESYQHPDVVLASAEEISAVRDHLILAATGSAMAPTSHAHAEAHGHSGHGEIVAIYVDATRTIHLPREWTGATPAELSVLVHEMVHHLQNIGGLRHACPQEREKLAFAAQERWLRMFGSSLADSFGIDPLTLLVRTTCAH